MKKEDFWKLFFWSKLEQIFSWLLAKNILKNWQNCFVSVQTNTLMYSQHLLWKVLPLFLDFGRNFFWIFEFFFFAKCENCFLRIDRNTSIEKIFFEKFSSFFGIGSKHFLIFGQKSTERLSELLSTCSKTCWRNRIFHFHSLLVVLSDFGQNFSDNWLKIFHKAVKTAFYVIRRTLWWKEMILETCFFSKFEQIYSWLLGKINLQSWQNCFLSVRTNTLMYNQQLLWKFLLLLLAFGRIYLWVFDFFFFAKLWKLFPKKGDEHFDQKHFFWKLLLKVFRNRIETFSGFWQKILGKFVRTVIYVFKNMLKKKIFQFFFFLLCSRTLSKIFLTFGIKFSTKLSKLLSTCSDEHFDEKRGFENLVFFRKFSKMFSKFWQELFGKVVRTAF